MSGPYVLACTRLADMPDPGVPSLRGRCGRCGMKVWIALSSPSAGKLIWCVQCTFDEMAVQPEIEIAPPTDKQMTDLERAWRRRRS